MAGMLPGVECARRRRLHQSGDSVGANPYSGTRRPSLCLYRSSHESYHGSVSSLKQRSILNSNAAYEDEKLGGVAREARVRLDERLRMPKKKSENTREGAGDGRSTVTGELLMEVYGTKRSSKKLSWSKLMSSWKAGEQDECTICLDRFKSGETLVNLPCAHRYHPRCLVPWLENNAHCPCCRMEIRVQLS